MGTEVHLNMQLPGCYSLTNLIGNSGDVGLPLPRENGNLGTYNDFFMRLAMGYDKEQMRQTIMKHDFIFRHQLYELHRLYKIQRDLMNETKNKERNKHLIHLVSSPSNPFSCGFKTEDEQKRWQTSESHFSNLDCFRLSTSGVNGIQSQFSPLKGNAPQSSCCSTQNGFKSKNCGSLESWPNKVQTRLFDLESPAREYINNEDGARGVSGKRSYDSNYSSNGEATSLNLNLKRTHGFTDLNEPILVEEASTSACVGIPSNISCFNQRGAEFFQEHGKARERWISLINPDLEDESRQYGGFSNEFENGQTRRNGSFHPEDLHAPHKSVQSEITKARPAIFLLSGQNKREMFGKRKFFGVEIPENSNGASAVTSHGLDPLPVHSWSDAAHSEILSVSSRAKFYGNSNQNVSQTYNLLNTTALLKDHDITKDKFLVDSNSGSLPGFQAEGLARNDPFCASDCKEPGGCGQLVGFCNQNGIRENKFAFEQFAHHGPKISFKSLPWMMEAKSTIDLNAGTMAANEEISRSDFVSVNGSIKQNSNVGLSWLRATRPSNAKPNKDVESLVDDLKHRYSETSYSLSSRKLGFSASENVCRDLPSPNTPLKSSSPASAIDGDDFGTTPDPLSRKCEQQCLVEGTVADKRPVNLNANVGCIDLNLSVTDEGIGDVQSASSSVRTNVRIAKIDLEMPVNTEMGTKDTVNYKSLENNLTKLSNLLHGEVDESRGFLSVSVAAEALIAISSSCVIDLHQNACSDELEVSPPSDLLLWFAEIVTSCMSDTGNEAGSANGACLDDSIPDGIDIFEYMTLNLKETDVKECFYKPQVEENKKSEDTLLRRPQRGQARRGRQRKDIQRDVLPNLTPLSRNEMTEDFHMIEGLIRAVGGSWQSNLRQKNNAKGKSTGRGRKREAGSAPPTMGEECSNQFQQTKTGMEQTSLPGWGKRTRRPPRPRCLISSPPLAIK
ncbi:hypothetical protein V6N13_044407 [Hibiscus sabdariffa]|uniref:Uncharacterized protein n=1 Tax=Hibiscus sabdariffa TaxID=183260 RepID=A0ABR2RIN1_9ROSI